MAINTSQLTPDNAAAQVGQTFHPVPGQSQTAQPFLMRQLPFRAFFQRVSLYVRTYTATLSVSVGYVPVGTTLADVSLTIGATTTKFKLAAAALGLSGSIDSNTGLATIVQKAITDNLAFTSAHTITATKWGAVRVQMDSAGNITTTASASTQAYGTNDEAIANAPAAAANTINLGTISIQAGATDFVAGTTALDAAGVTVNYNGASAGFTLVTTAALTPTAATLVQGTMVSNKTTRTTPHVGALLVGLYTSDGSMVVTDPQVNVSFRPYPLNSES